jgi:flavin reductase (DIM6/NTAB) family NADH-FMN oxidoreductase RutF
MSIDPLALRRVMSRLPTGVTVVSTKHRGGGTCGLTVNALASVSLVPPLLLVCVDRSTLTYPCLVDSGFFAASFLGAGQGDIAVRFAERRDDKFDGVPHRIGTTGAPILEGAAGHVECAVESEIKGGDHSIFLARVVAAESGSGPPLVFFERSYTTTADSSATREG